MSKIIRFVLTGILLYFVWRGNMTAIKISITLGTIANELSIYLIKKLYEG